MRKRPTADSGRRKALKQGAAHALRENATEQERKLWAMLRRKQMVLLRFRRQQPIGPYVVDFFCASAKLIVELDGGQHGEDRAVLYDEARTRWLETQGYRVLRFWNWEFQQDPNMVLESIGRAVVESGRPLPEALRAPLPETLRVSRSARCRGLHPQGEG